MGIGCVVIGAVILLGSIHAFIISAIAQIDFQDTGFAVLCFIASIILFIIFIYKSKPNEKNKFVEDIGLWVLFLICCIVNFFIGGLVVYFGTLEKEPLEKGLHLLFQSAYLLIWTTPVIICLVMIFVNVHRSNVVKKGYEIRKNVIEVYNSYLDLYHELKKLSQEINRYKYLYRLTDLFDSCCSLDIAILLDSKIRDKSSNSFNSIITKYKNLDLPNSNTTILDYFKKIEAKCIQMQNKKVVDRVNKMPDNQIIDLWKAFKKNPQKLIEELIK